ncbi:MAG TPA: ABC transporter permease [Thermoanaerobaculia bacterium]|nr:ABC transporter permease [Thermoanaerobaculia bacterium]
MDTLLQDLRFAVRTFLKRPVPSLVAVLTLALGIGATTAIFSVVDAVLLSPLPFPEPDRLAIVWASNPPLAAKVGFPDKLPVSPGAFYDWKREARSFESLAMMTADRAALTGEGEPEMLGIVRVSGEFFKVLGTPAAVGRALQPQDDEGGKATTVVLSHGLWRRRFGADRDVVGKKVLLAGEPVTVVGVMPAGFAFPRGAEMPSGYGFTKEPDAWTPMALTQEERVFRGNHSQLAVGRLKPGVSLEAARAEMVTVSRRIQQAHEEDQGWGSRPDSLAEQLVGDVRPGLLILLGAVGAVLLIACVNVANLSLAQALTRQKEIAVRTAMGAQRGRLIRQLLTESVLLSAIGGALGLIVAFWGLRAFAAWLPANIPVPVEIAVDARILAFTCGVILVTGILAGLVPALQTTRPDLSKTLREGTRGNSAAAPSRWIRSGLVVVEVAFAAVLVIAAGLLIRSFASVTSVDPGFRAENVLALEVILPESKYPRDQRAAFQNAVLERLAALPGVTAAGAVTNMPMSGEENIETLNIEGRPAPTPEDFPLADFRSATPGYFEAMGIRLVRGRAFDARDTDKSPQVAVIDETMVKTYWPNEDPIGKRFRLGPPEPAPGEEPEPWVTIVGIVGNVRHSGLHIEARPQMYMPHTQAPRGQMMFMVHGQSDPKLLINQARSAVYGVDRDQPVSKVVTMESVVAESVAGRRFNMILLGVFAGLALVLASVGIYGVTAYSVSQRTREMGLRMALGAQPGQVLRMVVREAGTLAVAGIVAGLALGLLATRVMASLLFGIGTSDPGTFTSVSLALAFVTVAAAWLPGRKATRVDPMVALRNE